ncbi:MAG: hypothetical protein NTU81_02885 [Candidatus Nomurabacteria bacterium]|nr:hypothetical protein [Candidatus Nomurabacteria bacterium]
MKKYFLFILFIFNTLLAVPVYVQASTNSGFIPGQIWYSKDTLVEGDTVNIHTAVWNGEKDSFAFKVEFYDKNVILGHRDVTLGSLELKDIYIPWKITSGDHVVSAKIVSSQVNVSGKKESVVIDRNITSDDRQFISVVVKNYLGEPISQTDVLKSQLEKTGLEINSIVPDSISSSLSGNISSIDSFRDKTFTQVDSVVKNTQKEINSFKNDIKGTSQSVDKKSNIQDATKKPITYLKLFFLSILAFIFGSKIVFYTILILIIFFILRFIYRSIRNR